jgi:hypothetical protein
MDTVQETIKTPTRNIERPQNNTFRFNFYNLSIRNGILAGMLMSAYLVMLQLTNIDHTIWLKFVKYLFLGIVLAASLKKAKTYLPPLTFFKRGLQLGAVISTVSALIIMVSNLLLFTIDPNLSFNKFNLEADSLGQLSILNITLLFEVFVYGMILTFIFLQFFKYQNPDGDKVI